jgi:aspartate ammonia-lyase
VQTFRALENFHITGVPLSREPLFVKDLGTGKKAAALANRDCKVLDATVAEYISRAGDRVTAGEFNDQFPSDLIQGGAGTSVNMNANEVIANVGLEMMG